MKRTLLVVLGIVAATVAHTQTFTHVEFVLTPFDAVSRESSVYEVQRPGQSIHLTGTFSLPQFVRGSSNGNVPWQSPFEHLTATDKQYFEKDYDVSGTGSTAGYHYWVRLDTTVRRSHDRWYSSTTGEEYRYGIWEYPNGAPRLVIVP